MVERKLNIDFVPAMRRLELALRQLIKTGIAGAYSSGFRGRGLEFSEFRRYGPGEDASRIDWMASKRTNTLLMRQYVEERNLQVFFLIDCSDSMIFGSTEKLKLEYTAELAASLAHAVLEAGDAFGFSLFSDKAVAKIIPGRGSHQFYALTKNLLNPDNYGGRFNFKDAGRFLLNYLGPQAIVMILSDFTDFNEEWKNSIKMLAHKFTLTGIMIRDPRDESLPDDVRQVVIEDPATKRTMLVEPSLIKYAYEKEVKRQEVDIETTFIKNRASFVRLTTDQSFVGPMVMFFRRMAAGRGWR